MKIIEITYHYSDLSELIKNTWIHIFDLLKREVNVVLQKKKEIVLKNLKIACIHRFKINHRMKLTTKVINHLVSQSINQSYDTQINQK